MFKISTDKVTYLKKGFLFFTLSSLVLLIQFIFYLSDSHLNATVDITGWCYYSIAALGHAVTFTMIPYILFCVPLILFTKFYKTALSVLLVFYFLINILAYTNGIVFELYKFHINGFVLDMVFGANAGQIFVFNTVLILKSIGLILAIFILFLGLLQLSIKCYRIITRKRVIAFWITIFISILISHLGHAYAVASKQGSIQNAAMCLPQFYPLTANTLMMKLGVIHKEDLYTDPIDRHNKGVVSYPLHDLQTTDSINPPNIIFLIIDSWNFRTLTQETCPNIVSFSDKSQVYENHLSSSNGTRGSIFGLFFGLSPTYWKDFEIAGIQPLFISRMLESGYDIQAFPSASIVNPPFYRVIFGDIKDIRTETPGATPFDRDNQITKDFLQYLDRLPKGNSREPFFSFLFYDLPHAIDIPAEYRKRFQPSWEFADYMKLNNDLDPGPYYNLYRNCVWHVDSLIGEILNKLTATGLLDNTVIIITGDHSQEFNENKKNYWGHGSNFSNAQIHVPLVYYYPENTPQKYNYKTTHYDIIPTLMHSWLGIHNPASDYSMGEFLQDSIRMPFHIAGATDNYAFVTDNMIYEKKTAGRLIVTDRQLNETNRPVDSKLLLDAINYKNRFLKKEN